MSKILYFEGAGWDGCKAEYNGVNCRIRTAFHNNDGEMIYLELNGFHPHREQIKDAKKKKVELPTTYLSVDSAFYITDDPTVDDENSNRIKTPSHSQMMEISYTLDNIKKFVNKTFDCSFDDVVVLDNLAGYRVFTGEHMETSEDYNFGDCFNYDEDLTEKRIEKVKELSAHFKEIFKQEYDNTSYYIKNGKLTVCINVPECARLAAGYPDREFTVDL